MSTTLALAMRASMSAGGVVSGANDAARAMERMGRQAQQTSRDVSVIKWASVANVARDALSTITSTITSTANAIASYTVNVSNALDRTNDLAQRVGMSVESLQALQMAAKLAGVDDVTTAVQKLAVSIGKAAEEGKTDAFTRLGLNFEELRAMSPEDQFRAVQQAIAALPTPAERAAAAVAIFGRSGVELLPLMEQNLAAIEERMRRLGAIVSEDQVGAIAEMNDALDMVRATFNGIIGQVVGNLAPVVTTMAEEFLQFVEAYSGATGEGGTGVANAITQGLFDVIEALATVVDAAVNAFKKSSTIFEWAVFALKKMLDQMFPLLSLAITAVEATAGDTTAARDAVRGVRQKWEESQTPEAKAARDEEKKKKADERKQNAEALMDQEKAAREAEAATKKAEDEAKKVVEETRNAEEKHASEMARLDDLRERNLIDEETHRRAKQAADDKLKEARDREAERRDRPDKEREKKWQDNQAKSADKQKELDEILGERQLQLSRQSNEALRANDMRTAEGMAQFIALATGREDPAIEENRKANRKLEEIRQELRALQQQGVEILGAAA